MRWVLVGLALLSGACGGDGRAPAASTPGSSSVKTTTTTTAAVTATAFDWFASPTGNIGCMYAEGELRCDVREYSWPGLPAAPGDCDLDWGGAVAVSDAESFLVCHGDTVLGATDVVPYGSVNRTHGFECASASTGMTCRNTKTGNGFEVSRSKYRLF